MTPSSPRRNVSSLKISERFHLPIIFVTARFVPDAEVKEIQIDPPNIRTSPVKKGKVDSVMFGKSTYNAIGEPFKETALAILRKQDRTKEMAAGNEKPFRPTKNVRQP